MPSAAVSAQPKRVAAARLGNADDPLRPRLPGCQRHLHLGDDAVDAVGVEHLEGVAAVEFDRPRNFLDRDDLGRDHCTGIGYLPPRARSAAGRAAGDEAADRRLLARRGMEAELPALSAPARVAERSVDVQEPRPRLEATGAGRDRDRAVEPAHVDDDAARKRHRLAVVAGAAAAHRERHPVARARRRDTHHLGLALRQHDQIGALVVEHRLQDRREPEEIAALELQRRGIVGKRDAGKIATERGEARGHDVHSRPVSKFATSRQSATKAAAW